MGSRRLTLQQVRLLKKSLKMFRLSTPSHFKKLEPAFTGNLQWYGNPSRGIIGMSNRVILNGGLSALRWNRTTISEPANLNLASAGLVGNKNSKANFLKTLPPKNWLFARSASTDTTSIIQKR